MFYELTGTTIGRGGDALLTRHGPGGETDERAQREFRQISLLMRRVAAIWPDIFRSLQEETSVLESTLDAATKKLRAHGVDVDLDDPPPDPLARYRATHVGLERVVVELHARYGTPWADEALRTVRHGLAEAAAIQGGLVDKALSV